MQVVYKIFNCSLILFLYSDWIVIHCVVCSVYYKNIYYVIACRENCLHRSPFSLSILHGKLGSHERQINNGKRFLQETACTVQCTVYSLTAVAMVRWWHYIKILFLTLLWGICLSCDPGVKKCYFSCN